MPRIPRRLPFSRQFTAPERQMYRIPEDIPTAPWEQDRGYLLGSTIGGKPVTYRGRPLEPIQGPRFPDRVEEARQRYLDALEEYQAQINMMRQEQEYNRALPERAARLKQMKWDEAVLHYPDMTSDELNRMLDDQIYDELDDRTKFWRR